jgi:hypothetical protein
MESLYLQLHTISEFLTMEKILRPVHYGIGKDTDRTPEEIEDLPLKLKNIYRYINEWSEGIKNMRK